MNQSSSSAEDKIWKANKLLLSLIVFSALTGIVLFGGYTVYSKITEERRIVSENEKCSAELLGCGKYGFNKECNIFGYTFFDYNVSIRDNKKFYFTEYDNYGNTEYDLKNRNKNNTAEWFCSNQEAENAGYSKLEDYLRSIGVI